jgi:hypothetical protein
VERVDVEVFDGGGLSRQLAFVEILDLVVLGIGKVEDVDADIVGAEILRDASVEPTN